MPTPVQLGAGAGVVTATVIGGYTIYVVTSSGETITPIPFKEGFDLSKSDYKGKLLSFVKKENVLLLVNPQEKDNKKWWEWAFENKFKNKKQTLDLHNLFINLDKAVPVDEKTKEDSKALSNACHLAYKAEKSEYKFDDSKNLLKNISAFCTVSGEEIDISEPISTSYNDSFKLSDNLSYKYGLLSVSENLKNLVKNEESNELWWKWAYKNLLTNDKKTNAHDLFKKLEHPYKKEADTNPSKYLNQTCDSAYKKPYSALNKDAKKLFENIREFCTPSKTKLKLSLPNSEPESTKIKFLKEVAVLSTAGYTSPFSVDATNKDILVNPKDSKEWWEWSYGNNFPWDDTTQRNNLKEVFSKVTKDFSENEEPTALNGACKAAYQKQKADFDNNSDSKESLLESIKKFCVPSSKRNQLQAPKT